jgi:hypothetical protein
MRSESEKSFDECQIRRARLQSLGVAYLSPQNKSLAQSFRYMRNKPTIIAFKTPSLERCEAAMALLSGGSSQNAERMTEEGRAPTVTKIGARSDDIGLDVVTVKSPITSMNYPVGKPLEVSIAFYIELLYSAACRIWCYSMLVMGMEIMLSTTG